MKKKKQDQGKSPDNWKVHIIDVWIIEVRLYSETNLPGRGRYMFNLGLENNAIEILSLKTASVLKNPSSFLRKGAECVLIINWSLIDWCHDGKSIDITQLINWFPNHHLVDCSCHEKCKNWWKLRKCMWVVKTCIINVLVECLDRQKYWQQLLDKKKMSGLTLQMDSEQDSHSKIGRQ